jgi:hypothetical protein
MKKFTLVLALLVAVGLVTATGQDLAATVSGSATATIGYDIDAGAFGIVNSATSDVTLTVSSFDSDNIIEGGWRGEVSLTGMNIAFDYAGGTDFVTGVTGTDSGTSDDDALPDEDIDVATGNNGLIVTAPTVTAKITNGSTYIQIAALDGFSTGFAAPVEDDGSDISVEGDDDDIAVDLSDGTGGLTFGMAAGPATITVFFATETGYDGEDAADNANFLVGTDIGLTAGPATIDLEVVRGIGVDEILGLGVNVGLTAGPATIGVAFDSTIPEEEDLEFEVRLDADIAVGDLSAAVDLFYGDENLDVEISSSPSFGSIGLSFLLGLYDLTATLGWGVDLGVTYAVNDLIGLAVDFAVDSASVVPISVAATITDIIPNVVMVAKWATSDISTETGDVTLATTISY